VTGVQTCALPISGPGAHHRPAGPNPGCPAVSREPGGQPGRRPAGEDHPRRRGLPGAAGAGAGGPRPAHGCPGAPAAAEGGAGADERGGAADRTPGAGWRPGCGDVQRGRGTAPAGHHRAPGCVSGKACARKRANVVLAPAGRRGGPRAEGETALRARNQRQVSRFLLGAKERCVGGKTAVPEERTDVLVGLEEYCREAGIELGEAAADGMRAYWRMVLAANERMNLTRITGDLDAVLKHFVDSLTVLLTGLFSVGARVVDVGTGAGFPGVPLKLARPDLRVVLVDATLKRVRFLETVIGHFGWRDVQAVHARAEMLAR